MSEELELLERVLLRLGCADTDEQLETAVSKFLPPVLLKITSPHEAVRLRVMEVLTHINKRLKSRPLVQIPIEPLLTQYQATNSSFAINFSIIYITMGFPRLESAKQTELAPILLNCLEGKPEVHQDKLLMLVLPLLNEIKFPEDVENRKTLLGLSDKPTTKKKFLSLLEDVLLLPYGVTSDAELPPGLSPYSFKRVIAQGWKAEELEGLKKGIVRFLCAGVFSELDTLTSLIVASADTRFSVATPALVEVNKFSASLDWTNPITSAPLYEVFCGNGSKIPDRKTTSCNARVRQKLLQYLLKCHGHGINTAKGIQVIFEALFGENTNRKCKVLALQFADNLIKDGPRDLIEKLSKVLLSGFAKLVGPSCTEDIDVQTASYGAIAQLARVCPNLFNRDLNLVITYFKNLAESPSELNNPIRESLIAIAPAFSWRNSCDGKQMDIDEDGSNFRPDSNQNLLLAHLAEHSESKSAILQNVTCVFLTTCYPETFVPSRYLLLIIAGNTPQLRESVMTHLYGTSKKDAIQWSYLSSTNRHTNDNVNVASQSVDDPNHQKQLKKSLPDFRALVNYVHEAAYKRQSNSQLNYSYAKTILPYNFDTYIEILDYMRICLWYSAGAQTEPGNEKSISLLYTFVRENFKGGDESNEIKKYMDLVKNLVRTRCGFSELSCLNDLLNVSPRELAALNQDLIEKLGEAMKQVSEDVRNLVGKLYGILLAYGSKDDETFEQEVGDMLAKIPQKSLEHKHGSYVAISNAFFRKLKIMLETENATVANEKVKSWPQFKKFIEELVGLLSLSQPLLVSAAVKGISLIGSVAQLPFVDELKDDASAGDKMETDEEHHKIIAKETILQLFTKLLSNGGMKNKIREDAAHGLGYLSIGDRPFFSQRVLTMFLGLNKLTKDPSIHIAMGQALVLVIQGDIYDWNAAADMQNCDDVVLEQFLKDLIRIVPNPHLYSRQACSIWLLALVKNCAKRAPILENKSLLQAAFTDLLSEEGELVQDVASRGMGIVFGLSDEQTQQDLAIQLLETLTGGRKQVKQVNDDTKLFEEGVLGKTPTGGNITTYKELCSLASDLNQPDLIYQFMQLANHNSMWNSKLGAAFGLQSISKLAKVKMEPYLIKIVPRLFRYKYDPTPKIQNSMISIWESIIADTNETIELYYWQIVDELNENLTNKEWRVRIACCLAVRDIIKRPAGLKLRSDVSKTKPAAADQQRMETDEEVAEPELLQMWTQLFRVMDDIHEGTRLAADGTAKVLGKVCVVAASCDHGKSGSRISATILPFLLETGVTNTVAEIRQLSIKTISELIDSSGNLIAPHLTLLVPCLLRATGELEGSKLSYLSARHAGSSETQEAIDSLRAEAAKSHYCTETLSKCLKYIDYPELEKMTPGILDVMKTSVSLGSKIASAHFLCSVSMRLGAEMTPLVSKYIKVCFGGLSDRNHTVRKYYASAIGHMIGYAKESTVNNTFNKLTDLYFDQPANRAIPQVIASANKRHTEFLKDYSAQVLPLLFYAMHEEVTEENRSTVELWKDLWIDISPGDAGIRMNLDTITTILEKTIENSSWRLKSQSANSIATIAQRLGTNLDAVNRIRLINLILKNIAGRTFQGKERFLEAIASLNKNLNAEETELRVKIIDAVMREARKEEPVYRTCALKALGNVLDDSQIDRFEEVYNMVWYLLDKQELVEKAAGDEDNKNMTSEERNKRAAIFISLKEAVCSALGKAWPVNSIETQDKYQKMFVEKCVSCLNNNTRPVQLSLLVALGKFLERLKIFETIAAPQDEASREKKVKIDEDKLVDLEKICQDVLLIVSTVAEIPHTGLKKEALQIVLTLIKRLKENRNVKLIEKVKKTFEELLPILQKDNSPEVRCRIKDIEEKFKEAA